MHRDRNYGNLQPCALNGTALVMTHHPHQTARRVMRWILAAFYLPAGILHLTAAPKIPIDHAGLGAVPARGHFHHRTVRDRRQPRAHHPPPAVVGGHMLALYAVCVFPANIKHAIDGIALPPIPDGWWY